MECNLLQLHRYIAIAIHINIVIATNLLLHNAHSYISMKLATNVKFLYYLTEDILLKVCPKISLYLYVQSENLYTVSFNSMR